jgi:hypothetical protein
LAPCLELRTLPVLGISKGATWPRLFDEEKMMPVMLFWAIPASIIVGAVGYYLITIAAVMDAALALGNPTKGPPDRRLNFKVIEGGRS